MNNSVQDASNLSWKLALVLKGLSHASLLDTYNDERLPVIAQVLSATTALHTHLVTTVKPDDTTPAPLPTNDSTNGVEKSGWFRWRNAALELYGVNYRFSDIVMEGRSPNPTDKDRALAQAYAGYEGKGDLQAGDRAPEAPGLLTSQGAETSVFKLLTHTKHSVFVFAPVEDGSSIVAEVGKYPADAIQTFVVLPSTAHSAVDVVVPVGQVLVDKLGHAHESYLVSAGVPTVVIIRPDGFIGAIIKDDAGVAKYFAKIFS